jgi:methyl-accepting chemotaxis protein
MSRSFSLGANITAVVAVFALGYAGSILLGTLGNVRQEHEFDVLASDGVPGALDMREARFVFDDAIRNHNDAMMTGEAGGITKAAELAGQASEILQRSGTHYAALGVTHEELLAADELLKKFMADGKPLFAAVTEKGPSNPEVLRRIADFSKNIESAGLALAALDKQVASHLIDKLKELHNDSVKRRNLSLAVFVSSLIFGSIIAWWIASRKVVRPVLMMSNSLGVETEGIRNAVTQLRTTSESLAQGASHSAAALETSSAALEQIASVTASNADRAEQASGLSKQARVAADAGSAGVAELSQAMDAIRAAANNIAAILKTIDEIAFQTNILALNAAVEAARAGVAGAGFAVVADEVRALAQRCTEAARETAAKIEDSQNRSAKGAELTIRVESNLADIVGRVRELAGIIAEIAAASAEQRTGLAQVSSSVADLDKLTQQNASMAEETSASAVHLNQRTDSLSTMAESLNRIVLGGKR